MRTFLLLGAATLFLASCQSSDGAKGKTAAKVATEEIKIDSVNTKPADNKTILAKREVPVLCYHQIRNNIASDSKRAHDDIIAPDKFKQHMKMLADSGYHSILPDQLYNYLVYGAKLPEKPIMITFDDTDEDQFTIGNTTLKKYGFKGVYFIMTVSIGKKGRISYMTKEQIKQLADEGNTIASHTYDHKNFAQFTDADWTTQIDEPTKKLAQITGKKIEYFAFPYGVFKSSTLHKLKEHGFKAAFILSTARDEKYPLYTIRRIIDPGRYTAKNLYYSINKSFNKTKS
ncbi:polysaccharide deacetylase family protein [Pedobacter alluvionis]|uniref:Peptidoglycan/xylan/chitin deacetylase (PgdA/CDA1 family) n=1 Tax=Pedobacter alluvionis TaxID=475253 RepID=A0A497YD22_9SPHI|nr:polysaccharide deacetylase family protein [Pedobacter alluvionis]RLJ80367.1 peptidoglycan/xylan/chitin deacetylase (PgdA/CDA1 family) [Pedobacter alluvionis]TFB31637.1 polysaccharide deacetylase family protein [Pedobacter alluvionis]